MMHGLRSQQNPPKSDAKRNVLGFSTILDASSVPGAGQGVFIKASAVSAGPLASTTVTLLIAQGRCEAGSVVLFHPGI